MPDEKKKDEPATEQDDPGGKLDEDSLEQVAGGHDDESPKETKR